MPTTYSIAVSGKGIKIISSDGPGKRFSSPVITAVVSSDSPFLRYPDVAASARPNVLEFSQGRNLFVVALADLTTIGGVAKAGTLQGVFDQVVNLLPTGSGGGGGSGDVTLNGVQTLANKTLTAPVINSPTGLTKADVNLGNADNTSDANKPVSTAQSAAISAAQAAAVTTIRNGVASAGDDLNKLYTLITGLQAFVGSASADGDTIVNTVTELLAVFSNYPEASNMVTVLAGKVDTSAIINTLTETTSGKVLDARQGKALKDLIDALTTSDGNKLAKASNLSDLTSAATARTNLGLDSGSVVAFGRIQTGGDSHLPFLDGQHYIRGKTAVELSSEAPEGPQSSAVLTVNSDRRGFLVPRMTTTQRNAITSPAEGLQIYNLTTHTLNFWNGSVWKAVTTD